MDANGDRGRRVVLVHDWLTGMRGGEKCLEVLCRRWPDAQLFTPAAPRGSVSRRAIEAPATAHQLPQSAARRPSLLSLFAAADAGRGHELAAAALRPGRQLQPLRRQGRPSAAAIGVPHVCYCFTPMRYAWHMQRAYFGRIGSGAQGAGRWTPCWAAARLGPAHGGPRHPLRRHQPDRPADASPSATADRQHRHLSAGRYGLLPSGRPAARGVLSRGVGLRSVQAARPGHCRRATRLGRPLVVIGTGQDEARLRALAGPTIHFLGWQPDEVIRDQLRRCRALLFPGEEDFGIVPVEAQACGAPVIAFGSGGATETVVPPDRRPRADRPVVRRADGRVPDGRDDAFEKRSGAFSPSAARRQALRFNKQRYEEEMVAFLTGRCGRPRRRPTPGGVTIWSAASDRRFGFSYASQRGGLGGTKQTERKTQSGDASRTPKEESLRHGAAPFPEHIRHYTAVPATLCTPHCTARLLRPADRPAEPTVPDPGRRGRGRWGRRTS